MNKKEWIEFGKRLKYASQYLDDAMHGRSVQTKLEGDKE